MDQTRNRNKYHTKCQSIYKLFVIKSIKLSIHIADNKMSDNEDFMADESPEEYSEDEYNSEDDEFLAFHDAEIEAQVRAEVQKMKEEAMAEVQKMMADPAFKAQACARTVVLPSVLAQTALVSAPPARASRRACGVGLSLGRAELVPRRGTCAGAAGGGEHEE